MLGNELLLLLFYMVKQFAWPKSCMVQCIYCVFTSFRFHVSGSCKDLQTYIHAISDARCVFDMAVSRSIHMQLLQ